MAAALCNDGSGETTINLYKRYVDVIVRCCKNGETEPLVIIWNDGREYPIDEILDTAVTWGETGGGGVRYIVRIGREQRNLFHTGDYWYVESPYP